MAIRPGMRATTTVTPVVTTAIFTDGLETGDLTHTEGGVSWGSSAGNNGAPSVQNMNADVGVPARNGTYAIRFRFGAVASGTDCSAEQHFEWDTHQSELWMRYWIYAPSNWTYRDDAPGNNKFFQLRSKGPDGNNMLTVEMQRISDDVAEMRRFLSDSKNADGTNNWPTSDNSTPDFIGTAAAIPLQTWTEVGIYYRAASAAEVVDGRAEIWLNGSLFHGLDWAFWEPDFDGKVNDGYLMGWANSGYAAETKFWVDDVEFWSAAPSWWSAS